MARKDVSLVINAKDNASKALDSVNDALKEFAVNQTGIEAQSEKTASSLKKISVAVNAVEKAFGGLDGATKIRERLDAAGQAVERLKVEVDGSVATLQALEGQLEEARAKTASFEQQVLKSIEAQNKQRKALKDSEASFRANTKAQQEAVAAQAALRARQEELPAIIARQEAALVKIRARYDELSQKMREVATVTPALQKSFNSSESNLRKNEAALTALGEEYAGLGAKIRSATAVLNGKNRALDSSSSKVTQNKNKVKELSEAHKALTVEAGKAEVELKGIERTFNQASAGADAATKNYAKAEVALESLRETSIGAEAALRELTTAARGDLEQQLNRQIAALTETRIELDQTRAAVAAYRAEIGAVGVPTREMAKNLDTLSQRANESELKLLASQEAVEQMARAFRGAGNDIASLAAVQQTFSGQQDLLSKNLRELSEDGYAARRAIEALSESQATSSAAKMARDIRNLGKEADTTTPKISKLRQVYNDLYGGSRQSLSITQRLRGEVLSMVAAYGGLYGVVSLLRQVTDAYQTLEAAQARLNVANSGNLGATADDMIYLRRQASRLGIDLGTLSSEFSKFAIATKNTNLEGQRTRDIFQSVAEAARVARISNEELSGIFTALTQIVSKGAVQMEELRQQLGDRLPGALTIMADGLNLTTAELIKMMEQGQITSDALLPFADELRRRFGPQLAESLTSTSAELGRLKNAVFNALIVFAEAGFLETFTDMVRDLTELLGSATFTTFAQRMSALFSTLNSAAGFAARNFQTLATVIGAAIGLKSVRIMSTLGAAVAGLVKTMFTLPAATAAATAGMVTAGSAAATFTGRLAVLRTGITALMGSTGIGLLLAVGGGLFANWITSATDVNELMESHLGIMDRVRQTYQDTEGDVEAWRESLEGVTAVELRVNIAEFRSELDNALGAFNTFIDEFEGTLYGTNAVSNGLISQEFLDGISRLRRQANEGQISFDQLKTGVANLIEQYRDGSPIIQQFEASLIESISRAAPFARGLKESEALLGILEGTTENSADALKDLSDAGAEATSDIQPIGQTADEATEALERMTEQTDDLREGIRGILGELPGMTEYLKELEETEAFAQLVQQSIEASLAIIDVQKAWREMQAEFIGTSFTGLFFDLLTDLDSVKARIDGIAGALDGLLGRFGSFGEALSGAFGGFGNFFAGLPEAMSNAIFEGTTNGIEASAALIREREGFRADSYWDVNAQRAGYGSDTYMRNGQVLTVQEDTVVTLIEAEQDLARRIVEFQNTIAGQIGPGVLESFAPQQQAALTSVAYNYGSLPDSVVRAIATGSVEGIAAAIAALASDNNGVNAGRRQQEAQIFLSGGEINLNAAGADGVRVAGEQQDITQDAADRQFEIEQQDRINAGLEREAEIEAAIREARLENPSISQEQLDLVAQQTGQLFDQKAAQEAANEAADEAQRIAEETAAQRAATGDTLSDLDFQVRQQELLNQGLERQALIEAAIREAKAADPNITQREIDLITQRTSALYDAQRAGEGITDELEAAEEAQERVNELVAQRTALEQQLQATIESGDLSGAEAIRAEIAGVNEQLMLAIDNAEAMWAAVGGTAADTAIAELRTARIEAQGLSEDAKNTYLQWDTVADLFVTGLASAFDEFARAVAAGENVLDSAWNAFLKFAADFLIKIAQMIIQQAIFNALQGAFGGTTFGTTIGLPVPTAHTGGIVGSASVGSGNPARMINPAAFHGARRYHGGGIVGMRPGETPIIAKQGENVQTEDDPYHPKNRAKTGGSDGPRVYNYFDFESFLEASLAGSGRTAIINMIRANSSEVRAAMES